MVSHEFSHSYHIKCYQDPHGFSLRWNPSRRPRHNSAMTLGRKTETRPTETALGIPGFNKESHCRMMDLLSNRLQSSTWKQMWNPMESLTNSWKWTGLLKIKPLCKLMCSRFWLQHPFLVLDDTAAVQHLHQLFRGQCGKSLLKYLLAKYSARLCRNLIGMWLHASFHFLNVFNVLPFKSNMFNHPKIRFGRTVGCCTLHRAVEWSSFWHPLNLGNSPRSEGSAPGACSWPSGFCSSQSKPGLQPHDAPWCRIASAVGIEPQWA